MSSLRASIFRFSLALILIGFAGTSFWYAYRLQEEYLEQEGYLWTARRENFLLKSAVADVESDRDRLGGEVATLDLALEEARDELSRMRLRAADLELTLIDVRTERDAWQSENRALDLDRIRLRDENKALTSQVFSLYMAANRTRWIDGMRDAGAWLDGIVGEGTETEPTLDPVPRWIAAVDPHEATRDEAEARLASLRDETAAKRDDEDAPAIAWAIEDEDSAPHEESLPIWDVSPDAGGIGSDARPSLRPAPAMQGGIPTASLGREPAAGRIFRFEAIGEAWLAAPAWVSDSLATIVATVRRDGRSWIRLAHASVVTIARFDTVLRNLRSVTGPRL